MNHDPPEEVLPSERERPVKVNELSKHLSADERTRVITIRMAESLHRVLRAEVARERLVDPDLSMQRICLRKIFAGLDDRLRAELRPTAENPPLPFKSESPPELLPT